MSDGGRDVTNFTCKAIGEPVPEINWYFNGVMINESDDSGKYTIVSQPINITTTEKVLTIYNATSCDVGVYTCVASNVIGNDTSHGEIMSYLNDTYNKCIILRLFI